MHEESPYQSAQLSTRPRHGAEWLNKNHKTLTSRSFIITAHSVIDTNGFRYQIVEQESTSTAATLHDLAPHLLSMDCGAVIKLTPRKTEYTLTYGDLVQLFLFGHLAPSDLQIPASPEILSATTPCFCSNPGEGYLPAMCRRAIATYLREHGIDPPQVILIGRERDGELCYSLAFNILREEFSDNEEFMRLWRNFHWFLPADYNVVLLPPGSPWVSSFHPL